MSLCSFSKPLFMNKSTSIVVSTNFWFIQMPIIETKFGSTQHPNIYAMIYYHGSLENHLVSDSDYNIVNL